MNRNMILIVAVLVAIAAVASWYFFVKKPAPTGSTAGLGADIYSQVAPSATSSLPQTNPFKAVQTNPFAQ